MNIALIAHDNKKADMVAFVSKRLDFFNLPDNNIVATGTTGGHVKHAGIKKVKRLNSGQWEVMLRLQQWFPMET